MKPSLNTYLFGLILTIITINSFGQTTHLLFDKNSDNITIQSRSKLDSIILIIKKRDQLEEIGLKGHTDNDASNEYNNQLSLNRANAIKNYLVSHNIKNRIHIDSKGETSPLNNNTSETEKAKNRRVEITLNYSKNNYAFTKLAKEYDLYTIKPNRDTLLECRNGTKIQLNKDIFKNVDNSNPIILKIQEYYSKSDFILANLTTLDINNNQLESRGMINIKAYQNDNELALKNEKSIDILFKDRTKNDNTEIYYGTRKNEEIIWDNSNGIRRDSTTRTISFPLSSMQKKSVIEQIETIYDTINKVRYYIQKSMKNGKEQIDTIPVETEFLVNELVLTSNKLNWINCDRFYKDKSPKNDLYITYTGDFVPNLLIVFEDINSVIPYSFRENNTLIFNNIPEGKKITFIGLYKRLNSDKIMFAKKSTVTKKDVVETINFEELDQTQVKEKIKLIF